MFIIKILVGLCLLGWAITFVQRIKAKATASFHMNSDPDAAIRALRDALLDDALSQKEYAKEIEKIVERTGYAGAMRELIIFYTGERTKDLKDDEKRRYWEDRIVKSGDLQSIIKYYGFTDYDVSSDKYADMLRDLNTAREVAANSDQRAFVDYFSGLVHYKMGQATAARELFFSASCAQLEDQANYMIFKCLLKEGDIPGAEKMLGSLEDLKFAMPAADYLALYNIYAAKRADGKPDYEAEAKYADRYSASEGVDLKTANRIGGDTYYTIAVGLEAGTNGLPKDHDGALKAYEKAAQYENVEALYYLGEAHWSGKLIRNYHMANYYLGKAAQKGHMQAKELLQKYGVDGVLVRLEKSEARTYQFLDGYELTATGNTLNWLQLTHGIGYKESLVASAFSNQYSASFKTFDQMVNGVHQLYTDHVAQMIKWSLALLMSFGIDTYDASDILEQCGDLSLLPRVPKFEQGLDQIDTRARKLNIQLNYAQATRGVWRGAGFGSTIADTIANTAKASLAAGAMNVGSGILHGIGDSIVKAMNNSEINGMSKRLFEAPDTKEEFVHAVLSACAAVGDVVSGLIERNSNIHPEVLGHGVMYEGESLAKLDDRTLKAKINNNLTAGNYKYAYALLVEHLRRFPFSDETLKQIMAITIHYNSSFVGKEYDSIAQYVGDFQVDVQDVADSISSFALKNG